MDFKDFFFKLPLAERGPFAEKAGTTEGYLVQVAYRNKRIELGLADAIVAVSEGKVSHDGLPLTDKAKYQRGLREQHNDAVARAATAAY